LPQTGIRIKVEEEVIGVKDRHPEERTSAGIPE
jgi:hypothetical protein